MNGQIGRIDGGVGLALESPHTVIDASRAGGAVGIVMGRNIWQSPRPVPLMQVVRAMIHENLALNDAVSRLHESR